MTRDTFKPATILNLVAGAWLQFMVHDWFVHARSKTEFIDIPTPPGDDYGEPSVRVPRSVADPAPSGSTRPPAYANLNSHWWDASQIYGADAETAGKLRTKIGGKLRLEPTGLLPTDPETGLSFTGFTDNWWVGLAMLHTLFTQEHNYLCDLLAHEHPEWNDDQLFGRARLINSALMVKIHIVEWTPAIVPHPTIARAMQVVLGRPRRRGTPGRAAVPGRRGDHRGHYRIEGGSSQRAVLADRGICCRLSDASAHSRRGRVPLPRDRRFRRETASHGARRTQDARDFRAPDAARSLLLVRDVPSRRGDAAQLPAYASEFRRDDGEHLDLAAVDILRDRERGVPRYNQFRRLFHKGPVKSFDELTDNAEWRRQIKEVYNNDLESVDLMTGLYAETLPAGFGFSETAFRIFLLMASRRLKSDRFFTDDYRAEVYGEFGLDYIRKNTMLSVLRRHFPQLAPALVA